MATINNDNNNSNCKTTKAAAEAEEMVRLERVLGCTACSRSLAVDQRTGLVAYPAGAALVLCNPRTQARAHLLSATKCQLTCLAWSACGQFIATGEFGTDPKVQVWALKKYGGSSAEPECQLGWHKLGISCVAFSADSELLISVGNNHDKQILVWDWRARRRLAESRLTCQVNAMAQSESEKMFVTVGVRHVKFWYLERNEGDGRSMLLQGRSAILADQRNNTFIACCCAPQQRTFALTVSRLLVEFVDKRLTSMFQLGTDVIPYALAAGPPGLVFLGFGDGEIRALDVQQMQLAEQLRIGLPRPVHSDVNSKTTTATQGVDAAPKGSGTVQQQQEEAEEEEADENHNNGPDAAAAARRHFPDVHALAFHPASGVLTALYSDRSIYHWLIQPTNGGTTANTGSTTTCLPTTFQAVRLSSQIFHVGPVFDVDAFLSPSNNTSAGGEFLTAGADETVRLWCLDNNGGSSSSRIAARQQHQHQPMSPELRGIFFCSPDMEQLTEQPEKNFGAIMSDTLESTIGVRCVRASADGKQLACGRRNGNICVFNNNNKNIANGTENSAVGTNANANNAAWAKAMEFEAHNGEVLCLEYGRMEKMVASTDTVAANVPSSSPLLLASGSRDRLVHVFDVTSQYAHLLTLDEHQGAVNTLKFVSANALMTANHQNDLPSPPSVILVSFGADQLAISRLLSLQTASSPVTEICCRELMRINCANAYGSPASCIAVVARDDIRHNQRPMLLLGCQDRRIWQFDLETGELLGTLGGVEAACEPGARITKLCLNPSDTLLAALCSDRAVYLLNMDSGDCVAAVGLPSDCVTGMVFSADCRRLLLSAYSGCISIWRLGAQLRRRMVAKLLVATTTSMGATAATGRLLLLNEDNRRSISPADSVLGSDAIVLTSSPCDSHLDGSLASLLEDIPVPQPQQSLPAAAFLQHQQQHLLTCSTSPAPGAAGRSGEDEEEELDSGIGGGTRTAKQQRQTTDVGGGGGHHQQRNERFELKRLQPAASVRTTDDLQQQQLHIAEQQQLETTVAAEGCLLSPVAAAYIASSPMLYPSAAAAAPLPIPRAHHQHHLLQQQPQSHHHPPAYSRSHQHQQQQQLAPPPYAAALAAVTQQQQQQLPSSSRSMSNLHTVNAGAGGRRRWNVGAAVATTADGQQQPQQQTSAAGLIAFGGRGGAIANQHIGQFPSSAAAINNFQMQSPPFSQQPAAAAAAGVSTLSPLLNSPPPPSQQMPMLSTQQQAFAGPANLPLQAGINSTAAMPRFVGLSNSVSLNAIRAKLGSETATMMMTPMDQQQQQSPASIAWSPSPQSGGGNNRNSLSSQFLQQTNNNNNNCVWSPTATKMSGGGGGAGGSGRRPSGNLFNSSGGGTSEAIAAAVNNISGISGASVTSASSSTASTPSADHHHHHGQLQQQQPLATTTGSGSRRLFQPAHAQQLSDSGGSGGVDQQKLTSGGGGGTRLALSRLKQRRMAPTIATAGDRRPSVGGGIDAHNASHQQPYVPSALRSRSQSPSQLALAVLTANATAVSPSASHHHQQQQQRQHRPSTSKAISPSGRSAISSTGSPSYCSSSMGGTRLSSSHQPPSSHHSHSHQQSPASCCSSSQQQPQHRLSSVSSTRLQQARQRLKKSQENLSALETGELGEEEAEAAADRTGGIFGTSNGGMARSRSIGNLRLRTVNIGGISPASPFANQRHQQQQLQQREMAKSVTDLVTEQKKQRMLLLLEAGAGGGESSLAADGGGTGGQGRLAECRNRLAQSIRDIRRISETDFLALPGSGAADASSSPLSPIPFNQQQQPVPLDSASAAAWQQQQQPTPTSLLSGGSGSGLLRGTPKRGVQKKLDNRQQPSLVSGGGSILRGGTGQQHDLMVTSATEFSFGSGNCSVYSGAARAHSVINPLFQQPTTAGGIGGGYMTRMSTLSGSGGGEGGGGISGGMTALRSASALMMANRSSPRSNYLAQKLAVGGAGRTVADISSSVGRSLSPSIGNSSTVNHHNQQQQHHPGSRSLSAELGMASAGLANAATAQFASAGSKKMALHAQECIREMQQACDKLLGTRQLIREEPAIGADEKRQLLANVNRALAAFAHRLTMMELEEEVEAEQQQVADDQGQQQPMQLGEQKEEGQKKAEGKGGGTTGDGTTT